MKSIALYDIKHRFYDFFRGYRSGTLIEHGLNLSISYEITVCNSLTSSPRYRNQLNGSRYKMQNIIVFKKSFFHLSVENVTALYQNNSLKLKKEFLVLFKNFMYQCLGACSYFFDFNKFNRCVH